MSDSSSPGDIGRKALPSSGKPTVLTPGYQRARSTPVPVPAADAALRILRLISEQGAQRASSIALALSLPRSSVYQLLKVLIDQGFVVHLPGERRYELGVVAFELGSAFSRQVPIARLARPILARLVDQIGQNAHLAVLHGNEVLYVVEERAARRPPLVTNVGVRLPSHLTASGRAMLAHLSPAQLLALYPTSAAFTQRTDVGPTRISELRAVLSQVRQSGWAREEGDITPGFSSVAAAVMDHRGHPAAGLAITYEAADVDPAQQSRLAAAAIRAAGDLGQRLRPR